MIQVPDIPRTRNGKLMELAVRNLIHGVAVDNREAAANPEALDFYANIPELKKQPPRRTAARARRPPRRVMTSRSAVLSSDRARLVAGARLDYDSGRPRPCGHGPEISRTFALGA